MLQESCVPRTAKIGPYIFVAMCLKWDTGFRTRNGFYMLQYPLSVVV